VAELEDKLSHG